MASRGKGSIGGAEGVAVVLDEPEVVLFHEIHYGIKMEGNPHRVSHHDGFCLRTNGRNKSFGNSGIIAEVDIYKDGNQLVLYNRIQRRGETTGSSNDFIAGFEASIF